MRDFVSYMSVLPQKCKISCSQLFQALTKMQVVIPLSNQLNALKIRMTPPYIKFYHPFQ